MILRRSSLQKLASSGIKQNDYDYPQENNTKAFWNESRIRQLTNGTEGVMTPIHKENTYISISPDKRVKYGYLNYMLMYRDSIGQIITEKVTLIPSEDWVMAEGNRPYDGKIFVKDWDENIKSIFHYEHGNLVKERHYSKPQKNPSPISRLSKTSIGEKRASNGPVPPSGSEEYDGYITVISSSGSNEDDCITYETYGIRVMMCSANLHTFFNADGDPSINLDPCVAIRPTHPYEYYLTHSFTICPPESEPEEPPAGGADNGNGNGSGGNGDGGGEGPPHSGGSSPGGDYIPPGCTPDDEIDYTIPLGPGETYPIPCSESQVPVEGSGGPEGPNDPEVPLVPSFILSKVFSDLTSSELFYLRDNEEIASDILSNLSEEEVESYELNRWGIEELAAGRISWEQFDNLYVTGVSHTFTSVQPVIETYSGSVSLNYSPITADSHFTESEFDNYLNSLTNNINGDPIELYLIAIYKNSKLLNQSTYSQGSNTLKIGDYILTPHYDSNNILKFYAAFRNATNGIEFIIREDALNTFKDNYDLYQAAANAFYLTGIPSHSQIQLASGDFFNGLTSSWKEAIQNPMYYMYMTHVLYGIGVNTAGISIRSSTERNSKKVSIEVDNYSASQFKNLIQQKRGGSWEPIPNNRLMLTVGNDSYIYYPSTSSEQQLNAIHYFRNGQSIGVFRFKSN